MTRLNPATTGRVVHGSGLPGRGVVPGTGTLPIRRSDGRPPGPDGFERSSTGHLSTTDSPTRPLPSPSHRPARGRGPVDIQGNQALAARYRDAPLGDRIGSGGQKIAYALRDEPDLIMTIVKPDSDPAIIAAEAELLEQVEAAGLPAARHVCQTTHQGRAAAVMQRYAEGSKSTVRNVDGVIEIVGRSRHLNAQSLADLLHIRQVMIEDSIRIADLQFLIADDGSVVISDPLEVGVGKPPSRNNLRMLELMIAATEQSIAEREAEAGRGPHRGGPP